MASRDHVLSWLEGYERAWRTPGTEALREIFSEDATYQLAPYEQPIAGLDAIASMWEREREGPDEQFTMAGEVIAVDGEVAVARVEVHYAGPPPREYRDLWIVRLDDGGRCVAFEEWPFWPGQARIAPG